MGSSADTPDEVVHETCKSIQEALELQVFAASQDQHRMKNYGKSQLFYSQEERILSPAADGITFMMLELNNRKFLIGSSLGGSRHKNMELKRYQQVLSFSPGGKVGEVGQADLVESGQEDLVRSYLSLLICLDSRYSTEARSDAQTQVDRKYTRSKKPRNCVIVGGGIRTRERRHMRLMRGLIGLSGTLTEDAADMDDLRNKISEVVSGIQSSSS